MIMVDPEHVNSLQNQHTAQNREAKTGRKLLSSSGSERERLSWRSEVEPGRVGMQSSLKVTLS